MRGIVIFDGECSLCNGFVAWLIRHDASGQFLVGGSQGEVGQALIATVGLDPDIGESTIVLVRPDATCVTHSSAVAAMLWQLGWRWRIVSVMIRAVPRPWRDRVYRAIADRRRRIHADDPACGVPPADLVHLWQLRLANLEHVNALATR